MDSFDDIWKNRFNEGELPANGWNTPDESVWEGVSAHIEQQKSRRRILLFWLISGLLGLLLFVGTLSYLGTNQGNNMPEASDPKTSTTSFLPTEMNAGQAIEHTGLLNEPIADNENTFSGRSEHTTHPVNDISKAGIDEEEKLAESKQNPKVPIIDVDSNEQSQQPRLNSKNAPAEMDRESAAISILTEQDINKLGLLPAIPVLALDLLQPAQNINPKLSGINLESPRGKNDGKKLAVSFLAGGAYLTHRISDSYQDDLSPFDFHYSDDFGWQAGLQLALPVNEWIDAWTGIQYEQVNSTSGHNSDLTYDPEAEIDSPNNEYALNLATPYGLSDASFILTRSNDVGTDEVAMKVDFESRHQLQNWSVPVGVALYPLKKKKRLAPSIQLGLGINYLNKISSRIEAIDTHHADIQHNTNNNLTAYGQPEYNNWHFDARLGAGVQYQLTNTLQMRLNYSWSRGLSSIFEDDANKYSTRIDRHALLIGITSRL